MYALNCVKIFQQLPQIGVQRSLCQKANPMNIDPELLQKFFAHIHNHPRQKEFLTAATSHSSCRDERIRAFSKKLMYEIQKSGMPTYAIQEKVALNLQESILETMDKVIRHMTGLMYEIEYYHRFIGEDNYPEFFASRKIHKTHFDDTCFTLGETLRHYSVKNGISPSAAIRHFFKGPTIVDCGLTVEAVFYKAMLDLLGDEKFDRLFFENKLRLSPFVSHSTADGSLGTFLEFVNPRLNAKTDLASLKFGDQIYVKGVPKYRLKHPLGQYAGLFGFVTGRNSNHEPLISALGLKQAATIAEIQKILLNGFNEPRSNHTWHASWCHPEAVEAGSETLNIEEMRMLGGGVVMNSTSSRLSSLVLSALVSSKPCNNLQEIAWKSKALHIAHHVHAQMHTERS